MRYLVLLYGDESAMPEPGTPEFDADLEGYAAFDELAGDAIVAGEALHGNETCRTVRHDGTTVRVTDGPFAETVEGLGGVYVLEAPTLDDVIELARHIPAVNDGAIEIRPLVQWSDQAAGATPTATPAEGTVRYLATIHGPETKADQPGSAAWDEGAARHQRFVTEAGDAVLAGGAVQPVATATTVRVRDGELLVTDGPYSETMEIVGGFYVLRATEDEAPAIASRIPVNDGGAVQLRLVMELDLPDG
jgi:hypothetical protein